MNDEWLNTHQAAVVSGKHYKTVLKAVQQFQRTGGKRGLEGYQTAIRGRHNIPRAGLDRWLRGETPHSSRSRLRIAS